MSRSIAAAALGTICLLAVVAPARTADQEAPGALEAAVKGWAPGGGKPGLWRQTMTTPTFTSTSNACLNLASGDAVLGGRVRSDEKGCAIVHHVGSDGGISIDATCHVAAPKTTVTVHEVLSSDPKRIWMTGSVDSASGPVSWTQTLVYVGDCPVAMRPDQKVMMLMTGADGKLEEAPPPSSVH